VPSYDQSNSLLAMRTTLAGWPAILTELEGEDRLCAPFLHRIRFATEAPVAAVRALVGTEVTLFLGQPGAAAPDALRRRPLNGHLRRVSRIGRALRDGATMEWEAEVVPRLWFLSQSAGFRIFHDLSVPQIVAQVLQEHGVAFAERIVAPEAYHALEYCVQYDETALDFVSRLLEQAGIFYWHEHTDSAHTLCFSDSNANVRIPHPAFETLEAGADALPRFDEHYSFRTGRWAVRDYNLTRPARAWDKTESFADVAGADASVVAQFTRLERYRYPGRYLARLRATADGEADGQVRQEDADFAATRLIEIEESHWERWTGESAAAGLDAGTKVRIDPRTGAGPSDYLVIAVRHSLRDHSNWTAEEWRARRGPDEPLPEPRCANRFEAVPHAVPFRPDQVTRRPRTAGPQTAIVVGPEGSEIHADEFGRVQVQFLWDRGPRGAPATGTACWIRVSQAWAGAGWGQVQLPRVGQEVIVDFLHGDPDRPIIIGRVHNDTQGVPYALPDHGATSGIRTRSTPGGTAENYNELRFVDAIGAEQVLLHAERDYVVEVENNETRSIGMGGGTGDRDTTIRRHETVAIGGNRRATVAGDAADSIDGNETRDVTGNLTGTVGGDASQSVQGSVSVTSGATIGLTAKDGIDLTAPTVTINADKHNRFTTEYDWQWGVGAGSAYVTTNFNAAVTTNAYGLSVNLTGMQLNWTNWTVTRGEFSDENKALIKQTAGTVLRNVGVGIAMGLASIATHDVTIFR
jgi:type VI secretion system secreted protein VgrG